MPHLRGTVCSGNINWSGYFKLHVNLSVEKPLFSLVQGTDRPPYHEYAKRARYIVNRVSTPYAVFYTFC